MGYCGPLRSALVASCTAILFAGDCAGRGSQTDHLVRLADLESLGFPDITLGLSPNGRTLAYAVGSEVVNVMAAQPGAIAREIGPGFLPLWSPAGDRLAFYSTRSGDVQLWVFDAKTRGVVQVTHVEGGIDPDPTSRVMGWVHDAFRFSWSPDGTRLVFASRVPVSGVGPTVGAASASYAPRSSSGAPMVLTSTTPPEWTLSGIFAHPTLSAGLITSRDGHSISAAPSQVPGVVLSSQLFVADVDTRALARLTHEDWDYFNPAWSPDGRSVICAATGHSGPVFGATAINLYRIDIKTGRPTARTQGSGIRSHPSWSPDGHRIAYLGSQTFYSQASVFVGPSAGGDFVNLTAKVDREIDTFAWSADGRSMLVTYADGISHPLGRITVDSGTMQVLAPSSGNEVPTTVRELTSAHSGVMAWHQGDSVSPGTIRILTPNRRTPSVLIDLYPQIRGWQLGKVSVVRWKNHHGVNLEGTLLMPVGYQQGTKYPLIVDAYPLVGGADWTRPMAGNQSWASQGYMVFRPSAPAPHVWVNAWKSATSSLVAKGPKGWDVTVEDVLSGVDELISRGFVDPDRMCLYGFSNGGGVVNYLVTRTSRFKCAVSIAGALSDWVRPVLLNTDGASWLATWAGVDLWQDPSAYIQLSSVFHTDRVKTPMLLADGDEDGDFLLDTIELYNGLRHAGVDVTLLRYPGQGHGFTGAAMEDFWEREMSFFARYLHPGAPEHD